jgi:hypothetical protein
MNKQVVILHLYNTISDTFNTINKVFCDTETPLPYKIKYIKINKYTKLSKIYTRIKEDTEILIYSESVSSEKIR